MAFSIRSKQILILAGYLLFFLSIKLSGASELNIAVASNFLQPMKTLANIYEKETGNQVRISSGSTGKLYAQIIHGAPYDLFFAANSKEPESLEYKGFATSGTRFTYAVGQIVLWSKNIKLASAADLKQVFGGQKIKTLAVANPKTAPYGIAALEILKNLNISLRGIRVLKGENINQTWQFTQTGNADVGFIAASQWESSIRARTGLVFTPPQHLYSEIEQQAVLLAASKNSDAAEDFLKFIKREDIQKTIASFGYTHANIAMLGQTM